MSGREANRARRALLVERAAIERDELADRIAPWQKPLTAVDQGLALLAALKRNAPLLGAGLGAGMAALAFVRPATIGGWFRGGQALWRALTEMNRKVARPFEVSEVKSVEDAQT